MKFSGVVLLWLNRDVSIPENVRVLLDRVRSSVAIVMLGWFLLLSVTASLSYGVLGITRECIFPVWAFVLLMLPEALREIRYLLRDRVILATMIVLAVCVISWFVRGYHIDEPRLRFMAGVTLLFPAATGWFRQVGAKGMVFVFLIKAGLLVFACYKFGLAIVQNMPPGEILMRPPIYRNLRHFNYDLALVSGLAGGFYSYKSILLRFLLVVLFVFLGYFTFWSGGRGQFLALAVMLAVLVVTRKPLDSVTRALLLISAFLLGGLGVMAGGESGFLLSSVENSARGSLNAVSSNRLDIWLWTLSKSFSSLEGALFGYGPESFERMGVYIKFRRYLVHPHNAVVQWVLEYGLLGAVGLMASGAVLAWRCFMPALKTGGSIERMSAITLIGMSAFALVDGVFYHAAPLLFMTLVWAYLWSRVAQMPDKQI